MKLLETPPPATQHHRINPHLLFNQFLYPSSPVAPSKGGQGKVRFAFSYEP
jgi:hypothetical protein